jgi:hypothetical protein
MGKTIKFEKTNKKPIKANIEPKKTKENQRIEFMKQWEKPKKTKGNQYKCIVFMKQWEKPKKTNTNALYS